MDFDLTEAQLMLKKSAREFINKECSGNYFQELEAKEQFPQEVWSKMAERGWFALLVPKEYGGMGGTLFDAVLLDEELARGGAALAVPFGISVYIGTSSIKEHGTEEQKQFFLPRIAEGRLKFGIGVTEPDGGTDILNATKTTAIPNGKHFLINGQKMFMTASGDVDYMNILAITDRSAAKKTQSLSLFTIDANSPGVEIRNMKTLGSKAGGTGEVFFTDVRVPKENLLGEMNQGWRYMVGTLNNHRIMIAAISMGLAQAAIDYAVQYAKDRQAFGKPIGQFQKIQHYLARATVETQLARWSVYRAAWLQSQGQECSLDASAAKFAASEAAVFTTEVGMRIMAGHGYMMDYDMQRYFRDARLFTLAPITNEMVLNQIGESLGLPRSY